MMAPANFRILSIAGRPVMAIPCGSLRMRYNAVGTYPAGTWKRSMVRTWLRAMALSGCDRLFRHSAILSCGSGKRIDAAAWLDRIRQHLDRPDIVLAVIWPAEAARGRMHAWVLDAGGQAMGFVKLGLDQANNLRIANEIRILKDLGATPPAHFRVPRILDEGDHEGCLYVVTERLPAGVSGYTEGRFPEEAIAELGGKHTRAEADQVRALHWWRRYASAAEDVPSFAAEMERQLALGIELCRVHGDLGSTNLFGTGNDLWVIDWETSESDGPWLVDRVAFWLGQHNQAIRRDPVATMRQFGTDFLGDGLSWRRGDVMAALAFLHGARFGLATAIVQLWQ